MRSSFRQWHLLSMSTPATSLTCIGRIDSDQVTPSFFRFGCQLIKECRPRRITHAFCQTMMMYYPVYMQIFHRNQTELVHDAARVLVSEVVPFPSGTLMDMCHDLPFDIDPLLGGGGREIW
jgi:hypothetical protein